MSGNFRMDDYVDVAQRIHEFYEKYPDGRLCSGSEPRVVEVGGKPFIWYHARAYRSPDDQLPGDGWAAEPVPGPTQFTRDSELMNAETAAWGRAIVALGFATKKIASRQEVQNRQGEATGAARSASQPKSDPVQGGAPAKPQNGSEELAKRQKEAHALHRELTDAAIASGGTDPDKAAQAAADFETQFRSGIKALYGTEHINELDAAQLASLIVQLRAAKRQVKT